MFEPLPDRNLTTAAYILTMMTLCKPLRFEPQQSVLAVRLPVRTPNKGDKLRAHMRNTATVKSTLNFIGPLSQTYTR